MKRCSGLRPILKQLRHAGNGFEGPQERIGQQGPLAGNPVATAAGIATLLELRDNPPYEHLERLAARLEQGLSAAAKQTDVPHAVARVGSMLTFFFNPQSPTDWESASRSDTARYARYFWKLLDRGVYMPCSQYEALFVSAAHSESDIDATIAAAHEALAAG